MSRDSAFAYNRAICHECKREARKVKERIETAKAAQDADLVKELKAELKQTTYWFGTANAVCNMLLEARYPFLQGKVFKGCCEYGTNECLRERVRCIRCGWACLFSFHFVITH